MNLIPRDNWLANTQAFVDELDGGTFGENFGVPLFMIHCQSFRVIWDLFDDLSGLVSCSSDRANGESYRKKNTVVNVIVTDLKIPLQEGKILSLHELLNFEDMGFDPMPILCFLSDMRTRSPHLWKVATLDSLHGLRLRSSQKGPLWRLISSRTPHWICKAFRWWLPYLFHYQNPLWRDLLCLAWLYREDQGVKRRRRKRRRGMVILWGAEKGRADLEGVWKRCAGCLLFNNLSCTEKMAAY